MAMQILGQSNMNTPEAESRDTLSDSHREFMLRYVAFENLKQERVSKLFLAGRLSLSGQACPAQSKTFKAS
jgi:hypothetical protein